MEKSMIIVHGVGDPLPGNALESLIQGLTAAKWKVDKPLRIEHLEEAGATGTLAKTSKVGDAPKWPSAVPSFPVARASLCNGKDTLNISEVYWGDLSRPKGTLFGLIAALFDLIFGLRYVVTAAANQVTSRPARWAAQLARASLWWARGPMFALNIVGAAVCIAYIALASSQWEPLRINAPLVSVLVGSLACTAMGWYVKRRANDLHWSPATGEAMVGIGLLIAVYGLLISPDIKTNLAPFIGDAGKWTGIATLTGTMLAFAVTMVMMVSLSLVLCAWAVVFGKSGERGPLKVVAFCTSLALGLFTFVVIALWVFIARTIREDDADRIQRCLTGTSTVLEKCLRSEVERTFATQISLRVEDGIHLLPLLLLGFCAIAGCFAGVMWANAKRSKNGISDRFRYIVNPVVMTVTVGFAALYAGLFLWLAWSIVTVEGKFPDEAKRDELKPLAIAFTALSVAFVVAQQTRFLAALDLLLDVIAHFRTEHERLDGKDGQHLVWQRIVNRFQLVLRAEIEKQDTPVVVIGHSQGTAIAAHGLGALDIRCQPTIKPVAGSKRVRLVTMGSPILHLYGFYMPARYTTVSDAVTEWLNVYRLDDYIGTKIVDSRPAGTTRFGHGVVDKATGEGGHTDYWSDSRAIQEIVNVIEKAMS